MHPLYHDDAGVSLALMQGDEIVAGLILDPNADELFSAVRGQDAQLNAHPVQVTAPAKSCSGPTRCRLGDCIADLNRNHADADLVVFCGDGVARSWL
jgi:fructose-1,6-bisphosphatase/inositol monophosphatase family enzyme